MSEMYADDFSRSRLRSSYVIDDHYFENARKTN